MIININDMVSVVLSEVGAERRNTLASEANARFNPRLGFQLKDDYKAEDVYKAQLWTLFEDFGDLIGLAKASPFVGCEINLDPE